MDTTTFARLTDMQQWQHGFGIALGGARSGQGSNAAYRIWDWAYGGEPPDNTAIVLNPPLLAMFTAIHLAGPDLTPEGFRDGMFRFPPSGGGPTEPQSSRGSHGIWPRVDWGGTDDAAVIWFDPTAPGPDEVGQDGVGMYRFARGGKRYTLDDIPDSPVEAGLFDDASSVTTYADVPAEDRTPDYPPPPPAG
jgi:hypothetical protein